MYEIKNPLPFPTVIWVEELKHYKDIKMFGYWTFSFLSKVHIVTCENFEQDVCKSFSHFVK